MKDRKTRVSKTGFTECKELKIRIEPSITGGCMDLKLPREVLDWVNCKRGGRAQQVFIIECLLLLKRMEKAGLNVVDCVETKMKDE